MNENTKILLVIAGVLSVVILFYEFKDNKAQSQDIPRIQDNTPIQIVPKEQLKEDRVEMVPEQVNPVNPQRKTLRQPIRNLSKPLFYKPDYQNNEPQGGCPQGGCPQGGQGGCP